MADGSRRRPSGRHRRRGGAGEIARGGLLRRGLGFDRADVAVVLNVAEDHLGIDDVDDLDELREVKQVTVLKL